MPVVQLETEEQERKASSERRPEAGEVPERSPPRERHDPGVARRVVMPDRLVEGLPLEPEVMPQRLDVVRDLLATGTKVIRSRTHFLDLLGGHLVSHRSRAKRNRCCILRSSDRIASAVASTCVDASPCGGYRRSSSAQLACSLSARRSSATTAITIGLWPSPQKRLTWILVFEASPRCRYLPAPARRLYPSQACASFLFSRHTTVDDGHGATVMP